MAEALGAILAGGTSRRMGRDKALLEVGGRPMVEWVAEALGRVCSEVVVVGREGRLAGLRGLPDAGGEQGPVAGLSAALSEAGGRPVVLVAVDQPFVRGETLARLLALHRPGEAVVPLQEAAPQVTCAVYPAEWREEAARQGRRSGSLRGLVERLPTRRVLPSEWRSWGEDGRSWFSVDTPEALEEGVRRFLEGDLEGRRRDRELPASRG